MEDDTRLGSPAIVLDDDVARAVVEAAPDGTLIVDGAGTIVFANARAAALTGYEADELLGAPVEMLVPEELRRVHHRHRETYSASPHTRPMGATLDLLAARHDGTTLPVEISLSPLVHRGRTFTIASIRDVGARRLADRQLADAHEALVMAADRERIARDLHDTVIQRLFAIGLSLQAAALRPADTLRDRVQAAVDDIDQTIRDLRTAIFGLGPTRGRGGLRSEVLAVVADASRVLGFDPLVRFAGPVDARVPQELVVQAVMVLREALSNVTRHAGASAVDIDVTASGDSLRLIVVDDGIGIAPDHPTGNGLANLLARARNHGGDATVGPGPRGGTIVSWWIPLR